MQYQPDTTLLSGEPIAGTKPVLPLLPAQWQTVRYCKFLIQFYFSKKEDHNLCMNSSGETTLCYGEQGQKALENFFNSYKEFTDSGLTFETFYNVNNGRIGRKSQKFIDWADVIDFSDLVGAATNETTAKSFLQFYPAGDSPDPAYNQANTISFNFHLPLKILKTAVSLDDANDPAELNEVSILVGTALGRYWAYGDNTKKASDGTDSIGPGFREAGLLLGYPPIEAAFSMYTEEYIQIFYDVFSKLYLNDENPNSTTKLPGFYNHNQAGDFRGPVKKDWYNGEVKACPLSKSLPDDIDSDCFSFLDTIFGEDVHKELLAIKNNVDSTGLFVGYGQVGSQDYIATCHPTMTPTFPPTMTPPTGHHTMIPTHITTKKSKNKKNSKKNNVVSFYISDLP
jgi:hypothetical protein